MFSSLEVFDPDDPQETVPVVRQGAFRPKLKPRGPKGAGPAARRNQGDAKTPPVKHSAQKQAQKGSSLETPRSSQLLAEGDISQSQSQSVQELSQLEPLLEKSQASESLAQDNVSQPQSQVCDVLQLQSVQELSQRESLLKKSQPSELFAQDHVLQLQSQVCDVLESPPNQSIQELSQTESLLEKSQPSELLAQEHVSQPQSQVCDGLELPLKQSVQELSQMEPLPENSQSSESLAQDHISQLQSQVCDVLESPPNQSIEEAPRNKSLINAYESPQRILYADSQPLTGESGAPSKLFAEETSFLEGTQSSEFIVELGDSQPQLVSEPPTTKQNIVQKTTNFEADGLAEGLLGKDSHHKDGTVESACNQAVEVPLQTETRIGGDELQCSIPAKDFDSLIHGDTDPEKVSSSQPQEDDDPCPLQEKTILDSSSKLVVEEPSEKEHPGKENSSESPATPTTNHIDPSMLVTDGVEKGLEQQHSGSSRRKKNQPRRSLYSNDDNETEPLSEQPSLESPQTQKSPKSFRRSSTRKRKESGNPAEQVQNLESSMADAVKEPKRKKCLSYEASQPPENPSVNEATEERVMETQQEKAASVCRQSRKKKMRGDIQPNAVHGNQDSEGLTGPQSNKSKPKRSKTAKLSEIIASGSAEETANILASESVEPTEGGQSKTVKNSKRSRSAKLPETTISNQEATANELGSESVEPTKERGEDVAVMDPSSSTKKSRKPKTSRFFAAAAETTNVLVFEDPSSSAKKPRKSKATKFAASTSSELNNAEDSEGQKKKFIKPKTRRRKVDRRALNPADPDLDPKKMTITEIIRLAEAKERLMKKDEEKKAKSTGGGASSTSVQEEQYEESTSFAPQVQIIDGQIVINQESLTVSAHKKDDVRTYRRVEETHSKLNYHSYTKRTPRISWRNDETELFYKALREFGTNFAMIQHLFPGKTRKQVLLKYKKEEKACPLRVAEAMLLKPKECSQYMEVINLMNIIPTDPQETPEDSAPFDVTTNQEFYNQEAIESVWTSEVEPGSEPVMNAKGDHVKEEETNKASSKCSDSKPEMEINAESDDVPAVIKHENVTKSEEQPKPEESHVVEPVVRKKRSLFSYQDSTITC